MSKDANQNPTITPTSEPMQLAQILSDLTSLRACDPSAALTLVSARPQNATTSENTQEKGKGAQKNDNGDDDDDADLRRAKDLLELHYEVKERHSRGELEGTLEEARRSVAGIGVE